MYWTGVYFVRPFVAFRAGLRPAVFFAAGFRAEVFRAVVFFAAAFRTGAFFAVTRPGLAFGRMPVWSAYASITVADSGPVSATLMRRLRAHARMSAASFDGSNVDLRAMCIPFRFLHQPGKPAQ